MSRFVYIRDENVMGEIVSQQLAGAYVKYIQGGFEQTSFFTTDDYEELSYFDEEEDDI